MNKVVRITIGGGVVQEVDVPAGITVVVRDYDAEGCDPDLIEQDESGDEYTESVWESEGEE